MVLRYTRKGFDFRMLNCVQTSLKRQKFRNNSPVSSHSGQSQICFAAVLNIHWTVYLLETPIKCWLFIIHFLPWSSDFLLAPCLCPNSFYLRLYTVSIHSLSPHPPTAHPELGLQCPPCPFSDCPVFRPVKPVYQPAHFRAHPAYPGQKIRGNPLTC